MQRFEKFAKEWEFEWSPSDPYHSQSIGKAESTVKIVKKLIKKTKLDGSKLWKAILDWRNTPTKEVGSSRTQRLMSLRTKNLPPTADVLLKPHVETNVKEIFLYVYIVHFNKIKITKIHLPKSNRVETI